MSESPTVQLVDVSKRYGDAAAVDHVDLDIATGEFFSLLGPSGCGKTTTLRMLAGFIVPDEGAVLLDGTDVTDVPPYRRDVNTVFQSYALFDHLTVADNIAFGLKRRGVKKQEIRRRVGEGLELVDLLPRAGARVKELSGGQCQRVALARALVNRPKVLLLDEPLGALDLKLRRQMQSELKRIQREVGITFVYVTHDQEEALTMSDRIGVMNHGRLEQVDAPEQLYEAPSTAFVAGFIGNTNLLRGRRSGDMVILEGGTKVPVGARVASDAIDRVLVSVRPEKVQLGAAPEAGDVVAFTGRVTEAVYLGASTRYSVRCDDGLLVTSDQPHAAGAEDRAHVVGAPVTVGWRPQDSVVLADSD
ncbi:ABC transporter ATP-binding protein [Nocardioides caldifontis]|uniref:ABC transporter ATP-binding protein n=1 Tax=Nocardioides caldifontis TaxID=2588938 RepID=UPI0011DF9507|nr:ABC transporter ATP-binding protein [Nocardioides caldifontis]